MSPKVGAGLKGVTYCGEFSLLKLVKAELKVFRLVKIPIFKIASLGHQSLPPTNLGRVDEEMASSGRVLSHFDVNRFNVHQSLLYGWFSVAPELELVTRRQRVRNHNHSASTATELRENDTQKKA
ncbi:hypothetical protein TNCV_2087111 [Trichonephila clavipes]|nr:hypothetical protein TNCV_2087111 [Trichonephila clavipes]